MDMFTWSPWTTTEAQMVPIMDPYRVTEATTVTVYIPLHMVRLDQYLSTVYACDTVCS